jgi:hypothetical protein
MNIATEPPAPLFASTRAFREGFERGLEQMLEHDLLGVFVLVLANASYEPAMFARLREPLREIYDRWCARFDAADELATAAPADDADVFRRLRELGFDKLETTRWREVGPWQLQFNPLRALRPPRMSNAVVESLSRPFDADGFHFNKPFLRREILWEGDMLGMPFRLLYNKFPFADLHGLLVPQPETCHPQFMTADMLARIWDVTALLGATLPGIGFGYNAYGAYASVNHLHLQSFVRESGVYPVAVPHWRHNGGDRDYPLPVQSFESRDAAWACLAGLHAANHAYNLLFLPGRLFVVQRRMQGSYRHSGWTGGFAWSETAGAVTVFSAQAFERLGEKDFSEEFARLAPT